MNTLASSLIIEDLPQADGRRHVKFRYVTDTGDTHTHFCQLAATDDAVSIMAVHGALWLSSLPLNETSAWLSSTGPFATKHTTKANLLQALREAYKDATKMETLRLGKKFINHINARDFTDIELRAAFGGLTNTQLTELKRRLVNVASLYDSLQVASGE